MRKIADDASNNLALLVCVIGTSTLYLAIVSLSLCGETLLSLYHSLHVKGHHSLGETLVKNVLPVESHADFPIETRTRRCFQGVRIVHRKTSTCLAGCGKYDALCVCIVCFF